MSVETKTPTRRRLGAVLLAQGVIDEEQLEHALAVQATERAARRPARLGSVLSELGFVTERQVASALAEALALPLLDLGAARVDPSIVRLVPRRVAERHLAVPLTRSADGRLTIALADPTNVVAIDDLKAYVRVADFDIAVASETQIRQLLGRTWALSVDDAEVALMLEDIGPDVDEAGSSEVADAPTVRLVNSVILDAVQARASDIHVEPQADVVRIRYRVDGLLRDVMTAPRNAAAGIVSRIKVMSNLDIAERRLPQDGRTRLNIDGVMLDARVSTLPNIHGEKVVVRLLSRADAVPAITAIGLSDRQKDQLLSAMVAPQGLILITGPTGSGKTSTLYSALHQIKTPDRNIVTLEDPVEMQVAGITQVQINERTGLSFARGLRSVLRQDPDVILVGEVRDQETAKLALEASLTGHLVLTTLHTNSAPAALTRLVDMGIEPYLVASSLSLVVAQRLVRRVCESCAAPYQPSARIRQLLGLTAAQLTEATPRRGSGCGECGDTGYQGRIGVFEVLPVTASMRELLMSAPSEAQIAAAAHSTGMRTLRSAAISKANAGVTTYEEVLRISHVDTVSELHEAPSSGLATDHRPRLLVVEDDPSVREYLTTTLSDLAQVDAVGTATDALDRTGTTAYQGLIVDNRLPDLAGVELIRLLRSEATTAALPVLMLTGDPTNGLEHVARLAGADDYLNKPVDPKRLETSVRAMIERLETESI